MRERTHLDTGLKAIDDMERDLVDSIELIELGEMEDDTDVVADAEATIEVLHGKVHAADCEGCTDETAGRKGKIDRFERRVTIRGDVDDATRARLLEIADKCPVHRTLHSKIVIETEMIGSV